MTNRRVLTSENFLINAWLKSAIASGFLLNHLIELNCCHMQQLVIYIYSCYFFNHLRLGLLMSIAISFVTLCLHTHLAGRLVLPQLCIQLTSAHNCTNKAVHQPWHSWSMSHWVNVQYTLTLTQFEHNATTPRYGNLRDFWFSHLASLVTWMELNLHHTSKSSSLSTNHPWIIILN